jgi:hypothetical protein
MPSQVTKQKALVVLVTTLPPVIGVAFAHAAVVALSAGAASRCGSGPGSGPGSCPDSLPGSGPGSGPAVGSGPSSGPADGSAPSGSGPGSAPVDLSGARSGISASERSGPATLSLARSGTATSGLASASAITASATSRPASGSHFQRPSWHRYGGGYWHRPSTFHSTRTSAPRSVSPDLRTQLQGAPIEAATTSVGALAYQAKRRRQS